MFKSLIGSPEQLHKLLPFSLGVANNWILNSKKLKKESSFWDLFVVIFRFRL